MSLTEAQATLPVYPAELPGPWVVDGWAQVLACTQDEAVAKAAKLHGAAGWSAFPVDRTCETCGAWGLFPHDAGCPDS